MTNEAIVLAAIGIPAAVFVLLRVNGALAFLSLCAGSVFLALAGNDTDLVASAVSKSTLSEPAVKLCLVVLPLLLCLMLLRKSIGSSKLLMNILPSLLASALGIILIKPLLPGGIQGDFETTQAWRALSQAQELVAAGGILISFIFLFTTKEHKHGLGGKHKR